MEGRVEIYCGQGRGKTSCAIGQCVKAAGQEYEVDGEELTNRLIGYMKKKNIKFESMKLFLPYYPELFYRERDKEKL